ncbi:MAG: PorT family protein [Bacteroidetes bacterium]|nr:PorT family protein [Bacteroidota bacterium]
MKKLGFLLILFLMVSFVSAQKIKGALSAGINISQVDGDEVYGYSKLGFNAGPSAILPIGKNFLVTVEVLFNQKGSYSKYAPNGDTLPPPYYDLRLTYLDAPVLFHYQDKQSFTIGTGFSYGRLVKFSETEHGKPVVWPNKNGPYSSNDINWIADVRFRVYGPLKFNVRYSYSLANLRTRTYLNGETRKQYNNFISARFIWVLGDTQPLKEKKKMK